MQYIVSDGSMSDGRVWGGNREMGGVGSFFGVGSGYWDHHQLQFATITSCLHLAQFRNKLQHGRQHRNMMEIDTHAMELQLECRVLQDLMHLLEHHTSSLSSLQPHPLLFLLQVRGRGSEGVVASDASRMTHFDFVLHWQQCEMGK